MKDDRRLSRRDFCAAAGATLVLVSLPACDPGVGERIGEGSLDSSGGGTGGNGTGGNGTGGNGGTGGGGSGGGGAGGSGGGGSGGSGGGGTGGSGGGGTGGSGGGGSGGGNGGGTDMGTAGDMAHPACTAGSINAGAASSYTVGGTPKLIQASTTDIFVLRDSGGLMAVSALCTHSGCTCEVQGSQYYCPCHGATFAFDGSKPTLPATSSLKHYAMCVDASGNVTVNPSMSVPSTTRY